MKEGWILVIAGIAVAVFFSQLIGLLLAAIGVFLLFFKRRKR